MRDTYLAGTDNYRRDLAIAVSEQNQYGIATNRAYICVETAGTLLAGLAGEPDQLAELALKQCSKEVNEAIAAETYRVNNPTPMVRLGTNQETARIMRKLLQSAAVLRIKLLHIGNC
jgi:hypothetical protein